ncbi:MAG TPA: hypothetical protein VK687_03485 [Bryobacteraceae bacterium]|jgi:hypothetical protein|nr:hypothetical protein [Bryobacteraceae bacterium]
MNKTLYVKDEDGPIWDQARELTGDKLSQFIMEKLRIFVNEQKTKSSGYERIVLHYYENGLPKAKAFYGRWIIDPSAPLVVNEDPDYVGPSYIIAETHKGNYVVLEFTDMELRFDDHTPGIFTGATFSVLNSLEGNTNSGIPTSIIAEAMTRLGIQIQELDI